MPSLILDSIIRYSLSVRLYFLSILLSLDCQWLETCHINNPIFAVGNQTKQLLLIHGFKNVRSTDGDLENLKEGTIFFSNNLEIWSGLFSKPL